MMTESAGTLSSRTTRHGKKAWSRWKGVSVFSSASMLHKLTDSFRFWLRRTRSIARDQSSRDVPKYRFPARVQYCNSQGCLYLLVPNVCFVTPCVFIQLINRCYLVTHAHLDHTLSLILLSGSVPPRPEIASHPQPPIPPSATDTKVTYRSKVKAKNEAKTCVPVFGTKETLERLSSAYGGGLWPELGHWANWQSDPDRKQTQGRTRGRKRKALDLVDEDKDSIKNSCGVALTPYVYLLAGDQS